MDKTFKARYEAVFNRVCAFLGEGWRIDAREPVDAYRINLINPSYKNYAISARLEKNRIKLFGSVKGKSSRSNSYSSCTVSVTRSPWDIASDIQRKILADARNQIALSDADRAGAIANQEELDILVNLLSRIVEISRYRGYYDGICSVRTTTGISGEVLNYYSSGFKLNLDGLSKDQLIKVVGFISTLTE